MLEAYAALSHSSYPKLLFVGDPGALVSPAFAEGFAKGLRNSSVVHLGPGAHYLQEDHPQAIGANIKQCSAVAWQHLNLLGEYDFSDEKLRDSIGIRPPKLVG